MFKALDRGRVPQHSEFERATDLIVETHELADEARALAAWCDVAGLARASDTTVR